MPAPTILPLIFSFFAQIQQCRSHRPCYQTLYEPASFHESINQGTGPTLLQNNQPKPGCLIYLHGVIVSLSCRRNKHLLHGFIIQKAQVCRHGSKPLMGVAVHCHDVSPFSERRHHIVIGFRKHTGITNGGIDTPETFRCHKGRSALYDSNAIGRQYCFSECCKMFCCIVYQWRN